MNNKILKLPIFIDERGDLSSYSSKESAEQEVELIDVKNNKYRVFDSTGREYFFAIDGERFWIDLQNYSDKSVHVFLEHLKQFIASVKEIQIGDLENVSLYELIEQFLSIEKGDGLQHRRNVCGLRSSTNTVFVLIVVVIAVLLYLCR